MSHQKALYGGHSEGWLRGTRFVFVGGLAFLAYSTVMSINMKHLHLRAAVAVVPAFVVATIISYVGNTIWSFKAKIGAKTAYRFVIIVSFGLFANIAIAAILQHLAFGYGVISVVVFITVPVLNFLGHQFWTFRADRGNLRPNA